MGKFLMKTNEKGSRFVLKAGNGEIIGVSETYSSESACKNGIESVRKSAVAAGLEDQTVEGSKCKNPKFEVYKDKPARATRPRLAASRASRAFVETPPSPPWWRRRRNQVPGEGTVSAVPFLRLFLFIQRRKRRPKKRNLRRGQ